MSSSESDPVRPGRDLAPKTLQGRIFYRFEVVFLWMLARICQIWDGNSMIVHDAPHNSDIDFS